MTDSDHGTASNGRMVAFRILAVLFALGAMVGLFGAGLIVGWFDNSDGGVHRVHDMAFGVVGGAIVAVGLAAQVRHPERKVSPFYQAFVGGLAALIAGFMASDAGFGLFFFLMVVIVLGILYWLHPDRQGLRHSTPRPSRPLAALAALGAIPALWFALTTARFQRDFPATDVHVKMSHWTAMTAMLVAIVLSAFLASLRYPGWRITAWSTGAGAFLYGLASVVFSDYAGSKGVGWGLVAMAGGLVFILVAEWVARSPQPG